MKKLLGIVLGFNVAIIGAKEVLYVPITNVVPNTIQYINKSSYRNFLIRRAREEGGLIYNFGKSVLSELTPILVLKAPFGYVSLNAAQVLAAIELGSTTIPIKIIEDMSHMNTAEFWQEAEKKGWVYPYDLEGNKKIPTNFSNLQDNPNLYYVSLILRVCLLTSDGQLTSVGAEYPVWIDIRKNEKSTVPFAFYLIAKKLRDYGINYSYDMGNNLPEEFVEKTRKILLENPVPGVKIIPARTHYKDIKDICQ